MAKTSKGHIQQLPSGSFRVKVYAGTDPVTGKARLLRQTCPDEAAAHAALSRMLVEAGGDGSPTSRRLSARRSASTWKSPTSRYRSEKRMRATPRRTIGPVLGEVKIRKLGADSLDALYTALKKCSRLCGRLPRTEHYADGEHSCDQRCGPLRDHRTTWPHVCDARCRPHVCKPMKPATILRIHSIISSALDLAVRYDWTDRNVAKNASPPHPRKREPDPPALSWRPGYLTSCGPRTRKAKGITDPDLAISFSPHPGPEFEALRNDTVRALEIVDEQAEIRAMSRGDLEAQVHEGDRAQATAPPDMSSQLRMTAQADADAWQQSADAKVGHDQEQAENARSLAAVLAVQTSRLEAADARFEEWSAGTASTRDEAGKAKAELQRRGQHRRAREAPGPQSMAAWWRELQAYADAVDRAIEREHQAD